MATRITRWATRPSRACRIFGTGPRTRRFALRSCPIGRRRPVPIAGCGGVCEAGLASCRINPPMPGVTEIVSAVIPCLDEEDAIGAVVSAVLAQGVAVPAINISKPGFADGYRFLQHGRKHRLKIAGRAADDLRHFRGRGLLIEGLRAAHRIAARFRWRSQLGRRTSSPAQFRAA